MNASNGRVTAKPYFQVVLSGSAGRLFFLQDTVQTLSPRFGFSFIHFRHLAAIRFTSLKATLGCLNASNAAPACACFGDHPTHFFTWVMCAAVVAINQFFCFFSHGNAIDYIKSVITTIYLDPC
jgi:hypothetical protein